ncbi:MAG: hypothetical protein WA133_07650 [Syntrophales bacterium]
MCSSEKTARREPSNGADGRNQKTATTKHGRGIACVSFVHIGLLTVGGWVTHYEKAYPARAAQRYMVGGTP